MWQLIGCRALMGVGAAFIMPSTLSILVNVFPADERTKAIAIWAGVTGAAGAIGPVASGWLLGHFWYGSVFLVNVPIIILALRARRSSSCPKSKDPEAGAASTRSARSCRSSASSSLVYGLIEAPDKGWAQRRRRSAAFVVAAVVLTLLRALGAARRRADARHALLQNPAFSTGTGGMILVFLAMFGVMFLITQYFQLVLGYSPLSAGAAPPADGADHDHRRAAHAAARARSFGANRTVAVGMSLVARRAACCSAGSASHTPYWYVLFSVFPLVSRASRSRCRR